MKKKSKIFSQILFLDLLVWGVGPSLLQFEVLL